MKYWLVKQYTVYLSLDRLGKYWVFHKIRKDFDFLIEKFTILII